MAGFHAGCPTVSPCLLFFSLLAAQSGPVLPLSSEFSRAVGLAQVEGAEGSRRAGGGWIPVHRTALDGGRHVIYSQAGDTTNSPSSTPHSIPRPGLSDDTAARFLLDSAD